MTTYKDQIIVEKQKIEMFQKQIDRCKRRILSLECLLEDSGDELDALASNMITATAPNEESSVNDSSVRTPKKRLAENTIKLLKEIGKNGKELKELVAYAKNNNLGLADTNIRNFAMIYRKQYGYIENPSKGFYKLTEAGINAIETM